MTLLANWCGHFGVLRVTTFWTFCARTRHLWPETMESGTF